MVTKNSCNEPTASVGKVLQGQGVGTASDFSTATYPSVATGTGTILRADGTNWVPTTATYPNTAGTNGNILTSDGTNWNSSPAPTAKIINGNFVTAGAFPADSTTYYLRAGSIITWDTLSNRKQVQIYAAEAFTLNVVYGSFRVQGTLGSAENATLFIRVNDTTNTNISTTVQFNAVENPFNNTSLGIALNAGDFFSFGITTPAWATNPTSVGLAIAWSN